MARIKSATTGKIESSFKPEYIHQAYIACSELGATDIKLAKLFNVVKATIYNWKKDFPDFKEAIQLGRDEYDSEIVENNLLKRATGYKYMETATDLDKNGNVTSSRTTKKVQAPDVTAQIFWLKNRHPDRWRDSKHIEGSMKISHEEALDALK